MADEAVGGGQQVECGPGLLRMQEVFDDGSAEAAVNEGEGRLERPWALGKKRGSSRELWVTDGGEGRAVVVGGVNFAGGG